MNYELCRKAVFDALCACLGLDKDSAEAIALIHEAYAEPENVPRLPRNRNVVYWTVLQDPAMDAVSTEYTAETDGKGGHIPVVSTTLKYQLVVVCYGPDCEAYASRIRSMLFLDGAGFPRHILRAAGIFPVPGPSQPSILYEEEGSLWRKRADLTVSLRVLDTQRAAERGSIRVPPAVILNH